MYFLLGVLFGICVGYAIIALRNKRNESRYLAVCEYWVYISGEQLPKQEEVMKLVLSGNSPVGPQEGLLFSDIRLHIALILRSKNHQVFRPDLFEDHIEPTSELLTLLGESKALVKIRYLSEIKLKSDAHIQLLPYLAYAYSKLADGKAIYDASSERLMTVPDLLASLKENKNARRAEVHLNAIWRRSDGGGRVETRGLVKKGLPELVTADVNADERILVTGLVEEAAKKLWDADEMPEEIEVESYNDRFRLLLARPIRGKSMVRILRLQST